MPEIASVFEEATGEGVRDDESVCPLTGYTFNRHLLRCPNHYHSEVSCDDG